MFVISRALYQFAFVLCVCVYVCTNINILFVFIPLLLSILGDFVVFMLSWAVLPLHYLAWFRMVHMQWQNGFNTRASQNCVLRWWWWWWWWQQRQQRWWALANKWQNYPENPTNNPLVWLFINDMVIWRSVCVSMDVLLLYHIILCSAQAHGRRLSLFSKRCCFHKQWIRELCVWELRTFAMAIAVSHSILYALSFRDELIAFSVKFV